MKKLLTIFIILAPFLGFGQKFYFVQNEDRLMEKAAELIRYEYKVTLEENDADYLIELLMKGNYTLGKPYRFKYRIYSPTKKLLHESKEWKAGGIGGIAENHFIKKLENDLDKWLNNNKNKAIDN